MGLFFPSSCVLQTWEILFICRSFGKGLRVKRTDKIDRGVAIVGGSVAVLFQWPFFFGIGWFCYVFP